jgi:ABC-type sugar transport system permease subunit
MITAYFTGLSVGVGIVFSLGVALLLNRDFRGKKVLSMILLVPWAIPTVVSGQVWKWIFNSQYGILNTILLKLNIINEHVVWLSSTDFALYCVVFAQIWNITPFMLILFLASLATVPKPLYDAALVDGANRWQSFRNITFPWIRTTFLFVLVLEIMWSFKSFDLVYVLTRGGPYDSTTVVYLLVYKNTFEYFKFGIGAALAYLLAIVILILTWLMYRRST